MFNNLFNKRNINGKCYVVYCFNYDQNTTNHLFDFLLKYFDEQVNVLFRYMGFYDERYNDSYGELGMMRKKIDPSKWRDIISITLDTSDMRVTGSENKACIDFSITRPIETIIVIPDESEFNFPDFTSDFFRIFRTIYGFSYDVDVHYWPTAYAKIDWEHARKNPSMKDLSKEDLARFSKNCEKIQEGFIRDVYKENILSPIHLNRMVNGQKLSELIESEKIGQLSSINEDLFFWELKEDEVKKTKERINKSGLII